MVTTGDGRRAGRRSTRRRRRPAATCTRRSIATAARVAVGGRRREAGTVGRLMAGRRSSARFSRPAGSALRPARGVPKQFRPLDGQTLLERSLAALATHPRVERSGRRPAGRHTSIRRRPACRRAWPCAVRAVAGGARRQRFGRAGVRARWRPTPRIVLVHDAARPFVSAALIDRMIDAAAGAGAAVPAVPRPRHGEARRAPRRRHVGRRDVAARGDLPGADPAGVPARGARARRSRRPATTTPPTKPAWSNAPAAPCGWSTGTPPTSRSRPPPTCVRAAAGRRDADRHRLRSASPGAGAAPGAGRRRGAVRPRARRPFRRRHRLPRGDRRGARRRRGRGHRAAVSRYRSGVEGRRQPRRCCATPWPACAAPAIASATSMSPWWPSGRSCCRTSRRCGATSPPRSASRSRR